MRGDATSITPHSYSCPYLPADSPFYIMVRERAFQAVLLAAVPFVQLQYGLRVCSAIHIHSCALPSPCYTVFFAFNPVQQVFRLVAQVPVVAVLAIDVQCRDNRVYRYYVGMPLR